MSGLDTVDYICWDIQLQYQDRYSVRSGAVVRYAAGRGTVAVALDLETERDELSDVHGADLLCDRAMDGFTVVRRLAPAVFLLEGSLFRFGLSSGRRPTRGRS